MNRFLQSVDGFDGSLRVITATTPFRETSIDSALPVREQAIHLNRVLRGHYAYYGIAGNFRALQHVERSVERYWRQMLSSRSRAGYVRWEVFHRIKARFPLQRPKLALP